jgi:hypothetical protein
MQKIHTHGKYHGDRQKQVKVSEVFSYAAQYGYRHGIANVP